MTIGNRAAGIALSREAVGAACVAVGRVPGTLARTAAVMVDFEGAYGRPGQTGPSLMGTPGELADEMLRYAEAGISHLRIDPDPCTVAGIEAFAPDLELLDRG